MRTHSKHVFILRTLATWNYKTEEGARKREVCRISKRWSWRTGAQLFGAETKLQISKHGIGVRIHTVVVYGALLFGAETKLRAYTIYRISKRTLLAPTNFLIYSK